MKKILHIILLFIFVAFLSANMDAQEKKDYSQMTKEEVMQMSYDELLDLPFEDLIALANVVGVSADELLQMVLDQEVRSASKKSEKNFDSPLSSSVVYYEEIKASGATCIAEALRLIPGVIVREKTNGNFDVHLRGNDNVPNNHMLVYAENSMTLVMIDGRPVYNYVNGGTFWETLPVGLEDINKIEVVRGPSSALYGPNAVSGVINIITKSVETNDLEVNADAQGGTMGTKIGNISASKGFGDFKMRFSGNYQFRERETDKFYIMALDDDKVMDDDNYYTLQEYDELQYQDASGNTFYVLDPTDDVNELFPHPGTSMDRFGANGFFNYNISNELDFNLTTGTQNSSVITTQLGDAPVALSTRESNTNYVDFRSNIYGFKPQVNYLFGWQNLVRGDNGFKIDTYTLNANLEYDFNYKNLNIRPGLFYQEYMADDTPYLDSVGNGIINEKITTSSSAASLRLDYTAFNKLRLIAAVRGEKYQYPDETYLTYQFVGSYKINDNHIVRALHSRANRGPFGMDAYANYLWKRVARPDPGYIYFNGNKEMDLLTMDLFEFGYRVKPMRTLLADLEVFYTEAEGFGALYPDSVHLFYGNNFPPEMGGIGRPYARLTFQNNDIVSKQTGVSAAFSWVPREDLALKVHGTYQETQLENAVPYNNTEMMQMMFAEAYKNGFIDLNGDGIPDDLNGDDKPDPYPNGQFLFNPATGDPIDLNMDGQITDADRIQSTPYTTNVPDSTISEMDHKATPSYYGGVSVNYLPLKKKLNIYASAYFYGEQKFLVQYGEYTIDPKVILNTKISYKVYKNHQVYVNARNLLNDDSKEYGLGDKIPGVYMLGVSLAF